MEILRGSFNLHMKLGSIWVRFTGREFLTKVLIVNAKSLATTVDERKPLYGIPALSDRLSA